MAYTTTECLGLVEEMFFPTQPKWEQLTFTREAWAKLMCYIHLIGEYEITGFGRVVDNRIIDIKILKQEVKKAEVDCDTDAMQEFLMNIPREEMGQWVLDWHSHVDMGVFASGTDTTNYKEQWKARMYNQYPYLIVNKKQQCHCQCYISPSREEEIKLYIENEGLTKDRLTEIYNECKADVEENCTKYVYTYNKNTYQNNNYNRYYGFGYNYYDKDDDDEVVDIKKKETEDKTDTSQERIITSSNNYEEFCWGCGEYLVGAEEYDRHVCDDCWERMTPSEQQDWLLAYKNIQRGEGHSPFIHVEQERRKSMDFDALNQNEVEVEIVTLAGIEKVTADEGTTVKDFKEAHGLVGTKIIDENSNPLRDSDVIREGMQLFVSTPKKNG